MQVFMQSTTFLVVTSKQGCRKRFGNIWRFIYGCKLFRMWYILRGNVVIHRKKLLINHYKHKSIEKKLEFKVQDRSKGCHSQQAQVACNGFSYYYSNLTKHLKFKS